MIPQLVSNQIMTDVLGLTNKLVVIAVPGLVATERYESSLYNRQVRYAFGKLLEPVTRRVTRCAHAVNNPEHPVRVPRFSQRIRHHGMEAIYSAELQIPTAKLKTEMPS